MKRSNGGFTLTEFMVSIAIFSFLSMCFFSVSSFVNRMKTEDSIQNELLNEARILMDKLVWGVGLPGEAARDGLAEAVTYDINGNTFTYTLPDGDDRRVVQSQDELTWHKQADQYTLYDPNGAEPPDPQNYSTDLSFVQILPNVVEVQIVLGRRNAGRWYYASLTTQIALRNTV